MSKEVFRRQFLKSGAGLVAGAGSTVLFGDIAAILAQSPGQDKWRYCSKCQSMFYQGAKGSDYDRRRGVCAAGGVHDPAGYIFVLPHDVPGTPTAQTDWRYCAKCQSMFYQGVKGSDYDRRRGVCAAGGVHDPAGYIFVLPHENDYPAKLSNLLTNPNSMQDVVKKVWNEAGRGIVAEKIRQSINGKRFQKGVNAYDVSVNLGDITATWNQSAPNQLSMKVSVPGNSTQLKTTTPTIFGSYGDPSFRVGFDIDCNLVISVNNSRTPITISQLNAEVKNTNLHGSNAVGTLVETLADFFTGGKFSREIVKNINQDNDFKDKVAKAIASVLDHI